MFCVGCGHEFPAAYTINFCPNCGQAIKEEHKIAKYTSDGKPINQTKDQKSIPSKFPTTDIKVNDEAPKSKGITEPVNYDTKYIKKPSSGKGTAIGALIVIVIIIVIVAAVANWFYQQGQQTDKLLELGCTPEAWGSMGIPTIWSCPAWRNIDVNDPKTFMDQSTAGPNR
jgi:predicted RNA-binding Zn-ribbon protein involved in translation (DUF1610 family)